MGLHGVGGVGGQGDGVGGSVDGFDAEHLVPLVGSHVGHFFPWIEDYGGVGVGLGDGDVAFGERIVDDAGSRGVFVDAVGGAGEGEWGVGGGLLAHVVSLVDEGRGLEAGDGGLVDIDDVIVGVERLFENEWGGRLVGHGELHGEASANGELIGEREVVEAEVAAHLRGAEGEGEVEVVAGEGGEG